MSLSSKLETMLGGDIAKQVLELVKSPQQKYMSTEAGKAARRRASSKWYTTHGHPQKGSAEDVLGHFAKYCSTQEGTIIHRSATQLWKHYCESGAPIMARKRYIEYLPEMEMVDKFVRDGKKVNIPAYVIDLRSIENIDN